MSYFDGEQPASHQRLHRRFPGRGLDDADLLPAITTGGAVGEGREFPHGSTGPPQDVISASSPSPPG